MNETLKKLVLRLRTPRALIALGLCGIVLIALSSLLPSGTKSAAETAQAGSGTADTESYRQALEKSIRTLVAGITGDQNATVVITLESGIRYTYADTTSSGASGSSGTDSEETSSNSSRSCITVKTADGGEQALLVTETMPEVRGVAVVCAGGGDEQTAETIRSAVTAALGVTSGRVYIAGGSSYEKR